MDDGWVSPTLVQTYDLDGSKGPVEVEGRLRCYDGEPYPRLFAEANADGEQCPATSEGCVCPLIAGHVGDHWLATPELAAEAAPIAVWASLVDDGSAA